MCHFTVKRNIVRRSGLLPVCQCIFHKRQDIFYRLIQIFLANPPLFKSFQDGLRFPFCGSRHLQVNPCFQAKRPILYCAPVSHNKAFKSPLFSEDIIVQKSILRAECPVDSVIAAHDGADFPIVYTFFKSRQIDFMKCTLIHFRGA